jgi:hypothetical protein
MLTPPLAGDVIVAGYCAVPVDCVEVLTIEDVVDTVYELPVGCNCWHRLSSL